ncbi:MAG: YncE family protein [Corticimicrobacter sp.]|uniref:YncE family protein n=1 Tax=Corticimicrobacter sp. TaxID=2678536 RepID=UPI0032DB5195
MSHRLRGLDRRLVLRPAQFAAAIVLAFGAASASAAGLFGQTDPDFQGQVQVRESPVLPGQQVTVVGQSFKPGQQVTLRYGNTVLNASPIVADGEGGFQLSVALPADAQPGVHPVVITAENPVAATVAPFKISPDVPLANQDRFRVSAQQLSPGLYQSAYSPKHDQLYVTTAIGRPPVRESRLLKVDPATLKIEASVAPAVVAGRDDGHVYAVYGVDVDDTRDTVWVTNTRDNTVAVYRQDDLSLVRQLEPGLAGHARDVAVDERRAKAYVSTPGQAQVSVFDAVSFEPRPVIEIESGLRRQPFNPMSLVLDEEGGKLFVVSATGQVAVIDTVTDAVEKVLAVPGARSASGVAYDGKTGRLFVASQGADNLVILDAANGEVLKTVATGAGALNVVFDPVSRLAYVSNRGANTVTVVDPDGTIVAVLEGGSLPNHASVDGKGNVYVVNKARGQDDPEGNKIRRLHYRR